jgi:hypothetical protein
LSGIFAKDKAFAIENFSEMWFGVDKTRSVFFDNLFKTALSETIYIFPVGYLNMIN